MIVFFVVSYFVTVNCLSFCLHVSVDGFDRVDPNESSTALKNQLVGLLQAVGYLKGKFGYFLIDAWLTVIHLTPPISPPSIACHSCLIAVCTDSSINSSQCIGHSY